VEGENEGGERRGGCLQNDLFIWDKYMSLWLYREVDERTQVFFVGRIKNVICGENQKILHKINPNIVV